ncbi:MAG: DUF839 domain-containing protein [Microthrixaceae bacterium]
MSPSPHAPNSQRRNLLAALAGAPVAAALTACGCGPSTSAPATTTRPKGTTTIPGGTVRWTKPTVDSGADGLLVPKGWSAKVLARTGEKVGSTGYVWPSAPDGAASFEDPDGEGWWVAINHEDSPENGGGVSALQLDATGKVVTAHRILGGTTRNCAGGPTPWGTWLSGEEVPNGQVWECDPTQPNSGEVRSAMGRFSHEAAGVDASTKHVYLTEDQPDGRFYRFTPTKWPDLSAGKLEVAKATGGDVPGTGAVTWLEVPDPSAASQETRKQVPDSTGYAGGEGVALGAGKVFFSTKYDNTVWAYDPGTTTMDIVYRASGDNPVLSGVDNLWWDGPSATLLTAEDGGNMELVALAQDGSTIPILRVQGQDSSEITGPTISPDRRFMTLSSQRGKKDNIGITWLVTGSFPTA